MSGAGGNCDKESATSAPNTPPLPRRPCPIVPGYQRSSRAAEPQRVSRFSLLSSSEGHLSGGDRSSTAPSVACEELEHSEESIQDSSAESRSRLNMSSPFIPRDEFVADQSSKKRKRCDVLSSERSGVNLQKMGNRLHGSRQDLQNQRMEQKPKNAGLAKHLRGSMADGQTNVKVKNEEKSDVCIAVPIKMEEKMYRVPPGGDGQEKKIGKKRPVSAVSDRVMNGDVDPKQAMDSKVSAGSKLGSSDSPGFRSNSQEGETRSSCPVLPIHGKVSSALMTGSVMALDSSTNLESSDGTSRDSENPPNANEITATDVAMDKIHAIWQLKWDSKGPRKGHRRSNLFHHFAVHSEIQNSLLEFATSKSGEPDDHEASVVTADSTSNALNKACSDRVQKKTESNFASVVNDDVSSYIKKQPNQAKEEELISDDTQELKGKPNQEVTREQRRLQKHGKTIFRQEMDGREVEGMATGNDANKMANKRRTVFCGTNTTKTSSHRVQNQVASDFTERTPARRKEVRETSISSSSESMDVKSADCLGVGTPHYTLNEASKHPSEARDSGTISESAELLGSQDENIANLSSEQDSNIPGSSKVTSALHIESTAISELKTKAKARQRQERRSPRRGLLGSRGTASLLVTASPTRPTDQAAAATTVPPSSNKELEGGDAIGPVKLALDVINHDQGPSLSLKFDLDGVPECFTAGLEEPPWDDFFGMMTP